MLRKMGNKLERLEDDIFEGEHSSEIVRDISNVKQEIINFRQVVRPQRAALKDLEATKRYIPDDLEIYFDDINDASERIWDMLENYKEVVEALESTNESVISHRINDTFRVLTAISVIVLPLTLIASIWGMNTKVPGEGVALRHRRRLWRSCSSRPSCSSSAAAGAEQHSRATPGRRARSGCESRGGPSARRRPCGKEAGGAPRCLVQAAAGRNGAAWAMTRRQCWWRCRVEEGASCRVWRGPIRMAIGRRSRQCGSPVCRGCG